MEDEEPLEDMVKKITPENSPEEIDDDLRDWLDFHNKFDENEWTWDEIPEDAYKEKMNELHEKVENTNFEFTHSAEEIRNLNRRETRYEFEYNGFKGSMNYSDMDKVYFGKVLFIRDLITYEAESKEKQH